MDFFVGFLREVQDMQALVAAIATMDQAQA